MMSDWAIFGNIIYTKFFITPVSGRFHKDMAACGFGLAIVTSAFCFALSFMIPYIAIEKPPLNTSVMLFGSALLKLTLELT